MMPENGVKPDPGVWLPLLEDYRLTSLPHDTILQGTLRSDLAADSPEVGAALAEGPHPAYLESDGDRTELVLVYQSREEARRLPIVHVALFFATVITTLGSGALMLGVDPFRTRVLEIGAIQLPYPSAVDASALALGVTFALPFLGVLLSHEMGHYWAARYHRVRVSLPYFIPFPPYYSVIGSLGAFIRLRGPTVRRSVLFDIGAAGPLASFFLSLPLLIVGLRWSTVFPGQASVTSPFLIEFVGQPVWLGNGVATHLLAAWFGPAQVGETLILLHPVALAGWIGLFVTALNLLPLGQLDGGHVLYALDPRGHVRWARLFLLSLIPLGILWWGWWAWAVLVLVVHRGRVAHPRVVQQEASLGIPRTLLGWLLIATFFLTFVPVPIHL